MTEPTYVTPAAALEMVATEDSFGPMTAEDLREAAAELATQAAAIEGRAQLRVERPSRVRAALREADELTAHAKLARLAADEVDRRRAKNVAEALAPLTWRRRWLRMFEAPPNRRWIRLFGGGR